MRLFSQFLPISSLSAVLAIGALFISVQANANSDTDQRNEPSLFGTQTDVSFGLGVGFDQRYMGSRDFRAVVWPEFSVHRGVLFFDTMRGVGVEYQSEGGFYLGEAINYDLGRGIATSVFQPGSTNLSGMGKINGSVTNTLTIAQDLTKWLSVNAQIETALGNSNRGDQFQLGFESILPLNDKDTLTLDLDAKFGDRQYNQTYFGVTPSQRASSGLSEFAPGRGLYAYLFSGTWKHSFDKNWSTQLIISGSYYTGKADNSPVVERKLGVTAFSSLNYAF